MTNEMDESAALLEKAAAGETGALDSLFARHRERLRRAVVLQLDRRLAARLDASDIVQDTYLEAAKRVSDYLTRPRMPFYLWLRWLGRERVFAAERRHLKAEKRRVGLEIAALPVESSAQFVRGVIGSGQSPSQAAAAGELADRLRAALEQLDPDECELIMWRHFEQLSNRECAQLLGIAEPAAGKRYIRAAY